MSKKPRKVPNFRAKKTYLRACFFLFLCNVLLLSQRIQKCNKKWKVPIFFLGSLSDMPYLQETLKIDVATYYKCWKKFTTYGRHHDTYKTCLQLSQLSSTLHGWIVLMSPWLHFWTNSVQIGCAWSVSCTHLAMNIIWLPAVCPK